MTWDLSTFEPGKGWRLLCCTPDVQWAWTWYLRSPFRRRVRARSS